jgi:hypothetical protein
MKLLEACDDQLRDPDDLGAYSLSTRADSIRVIYQERDKLTGRLIRKRAPLQELLTRIGVAVETLGDSVSPALLMLQTMNLMMKHLALRAKLEVSAP